MKGIILAGGLSTRLYPVTQVVSKQLLPVYDKPMIYYPLSVLMLARIREILIISTQRDLPWIEDLLADGSRFGLKFSYAVQDFPNGVAEAFLIAREFLNGDRCALVLGDNILYGHNIYAFLNRAIHRETGATIFGYEVHDPERFGVVEIGADGCALSIEEKPTMPKSHWAVIGLYFYDNQVCDIAAQLKPSKRGELEITDINLHYMSRGSLYVEKLHRGFAWLDCGNPDALQEASHYMQTLQKRQRYRIACVEEIAYRMGYIDVDQMRRLGESIANSEYGQYLLDIADEVKSSPAHPDRQ